MYIGLKQFENKTGIPVTGWQELAGVVPAFGAPIAFWLSRIFAEKFLNWLSYADFRHPEN